MNKFKIRLLLAVLLTLSLCVLGGCSDGNPSDTPSPSDTASPSDEVTPSDDTSPSGTASPSDDTGEQPEDYTLTLAIDTTGMEELSSNETMKDGLLYIRLETYDAISEYAYDGESIVTRIKELEGDDITIISSGFFEEFPSSYPTMKIEYQSGANEDTCLCIDMYFATDTNEYRAHTSIPIDYAEEYKDEMVQRLLTVALVDSRD